VTRPICLRPGGRRTYGSNEINEGTQTKIQRQLQITVRNLRCRMCEEELSGDLVEELALETKNFWGQKLIQQSFPAYRREKDFDRVWEGFVALLRECATVADSWETLLDEFDGKDQIPLMTIHKSKGL
jgi:ATP-dependent exoDNAse (exonuclease V) beta subunit